MSEVITNNTVVKVVNKRNSSYTVTLPTGEYYEWLPAQFGVEAYHDIPFKDVQYLHVRSATFKRGFLYIDNQEARRRLGLEKEEVQTLTMSREEIEKLLKGNMAQIKKLDKVKDERALVQEVIDVAREIKLDNHSKLTYLSELSGIPVELIVPKEDEE